MPFSANEVLIKTKILQKDLDGLSALKPELAKKMGAKLKDAYAWTRPVAMDFKKYDKLKSSKKLKGKSGLKYAVKVDSKLKSVIFSVMEGSKELENVAIFSKLKDIIKEAEVINLQPGDRVMDSASSKQAKKFNADANAKTDADDPAKLNKINKKKKIVLCGHGGRSDVPGADQIYTANKFGGKNADEIVKFLIKQGLSKSYQGTIYLSGCHTAAGFNDPKSFANKVHKGLASKGYKKLSVAGTPGSAWTSAGGDKGAIPAALSKDLTKTKERTEKLIKNLEKALKQGQPELVRTEAMVSQFESDYASARELIKDTPPEAHATLEEKLLKPIKESRDELIEPLEQMRRANNTLENAIDSEKEYLKKVKKLLKQRDKLEAGKITQSDYYRKEEELFTVNEWWGHFGPAKATAAKVSKKRTKFKGLISAVKKKFK
jgi:hypothetical protein